MAKFSVKVYLNDDLRKDVTLKVEADNFDEAAAKVVTVIGEDRYIRDDRGTVVEFYSQKIVRRIEVYKQPE